MSDFLLTNRSRCSVHEFHALDSTNDENIANEREQRVQGHEHQGASERAATGLDDITTVDSSMPATMGIFRASVREPEDFRSGTSACLHATTKSYSGNHPPTACARYPSVRSALPSLATPGCYMRPAPYRADVARPSNHPAPSLEMSGSIPLRCDFLCQHFPWLSPIVGMELDNVKCARQSQPG